MTGGPFNSLKVSCVFCGTKSLDVARYLRIAAS
jgi:hypothetical protein